MNSYFLLIKYAAVKMEQGPRLGTNEEVGVLCSNSWWDFLASQILHICTKAWSWARSSCEQGGLKSTDCFLGCRTCVRGNCYIVLADGNCICFAFAAFVCHTPHGLLTELCSVIVDQTTYPSSWLTHTNTRAHNNLVRFLTIKGPFLFFLKLVLWVSARDSASSRTRRKDNKGRYPANSDALLSFPGLFTQSRATWEGELSIWTLQEKCKGLSVCPVFTKAWKLTKL